MIKLQFVNFIIQIELRNRTFIKGKNYILKLKKPRLNYRNPHKRISKTKNKRYFFLF